MVSPHAVVDEGYSYSYSCLDVPWSVWCLWLVATEQRCSGAGTRGDGVPPLFWTEIRAKVSPLLQTVATGYLLKRSVRQFQYSRINIDLLQTIKSQDKTKDPLWQFF